jgi:hypothetical protein
VRNVVESMGALFVVVGAAGIVDGGMRCRLRRLIRPAAVMQRQDVAAGGRNNY